MSDSVRIECEVSIEDRDEIARLAAIMKTKFSRMAGCVIKCGLEKTNAKVP